MHYITPHSGATPRLHRSSSSSAHPSKLTLLPTSTLPCYSGRKCGITSSVFMFVTFFLRLCDFCVVMKLDMTAICFLRIRRFSVNTSVWILLSKQGCVMRCASASKCFSLSLSAFSDPQKKKKHVSFSHVFICHGQAHGTTRVPPNGTGFILFPITC